MPRQNVPLLGFNGGVVSVEALTRTDLERMRFAAERMDNLLPNTLGAMKMRPGTKHIGSTKSDAVGRLVKFVKNATDKASIELTANVMRVWYNDALVSRPTVATAVANPSFTVDLASWTDDDDGGAASTHHASGYMQLLGSGTSYARRYQQVTVAGPDQNVQHALKITVTRGPIYLRVGSSATNDTYIAETKLRTGQFSLAFTPTGDFFVVVYSKARVPKLIDQITLETGTMELVTPWASGDLDNVRAETQSGDVIFCPCRGVRPQRIERYDFNSWGVADYAPDDGPFRLPFESEVRLTPSANKGSITLTANRAFFKVGHVGALFQLTHGGQEHTETATGEDQWTEAVRISGVSGTNEPPTGRGVGITIAGLSGTGSGVRLERSVGAPGAWLPIETYSADGSSFYNDPDDNSIVYFRLGVPIGAYVAGTISLRIATSQGIQNGVVRITERASATSVTADVVRPLGAITATDRWREGEWSTTRGFPSSNEIFDGRLWWAMSDKVFGSISDAYESFDPDFEGDAGPINRSIAVGPVDGLYWMLGLQRLLVGGLSQEVSIRSSSFDEPLTPTKFGARVCSSHGSANIAAVALDTVGIFAQRSLKKLIELVFDINAQDYGPRDLTRLNPDILSAEVVRIAVQRQPEPRIWCILDDGTAGVLLYNRQDNVVGWSTFSTDGNVLDIVCLPGEEEDDVYFLLQRVINAVTRRYVEKLAKESECVGGTLNYVADCSKVVTSDGAGVFAGLSHLEGESVTVWGGGVAIKDQDSLIAVSGNQFTIGGSPNTEAVIGLPYDGEYKSMKLAFAAGAGTAVGQKKRVYRLSLLLNNTGWKGIKIGRDFSNLRAIPQMYQGEALATTAILDGYDAHASSFAGGFDTDSRVCIEVKAPYPATITGMVVAMETNDGSRPPGQ